MCPLCTVYRNAQIKQFKIKNISVTLKSKSSPFKTPCLFYKILLFV